MTYQADFDNKIIFQVFNLKNEKKCILLSKTDTLSEVYNKIATTLISLEDGGTTYKPPIRPDTKGIQLQDIYTCCCNQKRPKFKLYTHFKTGDKLFCIPNKSGKTIGDFIVNNEEYFVDCVHMRTIHPLYQIYIVEDSMKQKWKESTKSETRAPYVMYNQISRLFSCFGTK